MLLARDSREDVVRSRVVVPKSKSVLQKIAAPFHAMVVVVIQRWPSLMQRVQNLIRRQRLPQDSPERRIVSVSRIMRSPSQRDNPQMRYRLDFTPLRLVHDVAHDGQENGVTGQLCSGTFHYHQILLATSTLPWQLQSHDDGAWGNKSTSFLSLVKRERAQT